jgi:outer membrane protein OmpA-like peptidoglycan-associated protein
MVKGKIMNIKRLLLLLILIAVVFVYSCGQKEIVEVKLPEGKSAEVIFVVGEVFVTSSSGAWIKLDVGDVLDEGVKIKTEANSYCELVLSSGTVFRMKDRSELQLVMLPVDENQNKSLIKMVTGELFTRASRVAYKSEDTIATKTATLGVRGTEFLVKSEDGSSLGYTEVLVSEGVVSVKMNVPGPQKSEVQRELKRVMDKIDRGVKLREGTRIKIEDQKVSDLSDTLIELSQKEVITDAELARLKEESALRFSPMTEEDKRRIAEFETLSLSFKTGDTYWISPNFDGNNDDFNFSTEAFTEDKIYGWELIITDGRSKVEKVIKSRMSEEGNFALLPEYITWNMADDDGGTVLDGPYVYEFYTKDKNNQATLKIKGRIIVDTMPPLLRVTARDTTFSPNDDEIKDTIIMDTKAEPEIEWTCTITTPEGIVVKTVELGTEIPEVFEWDGKGENGTVLPEGVYNISFSGQDEAGNVTVETVPEVTLDARERSAAVDVDNPIFSPNGDGSLDSVTFYPILSDRTRIDTWDLIVQTVKGETARRFRGIRYVPPSIEWDGVPQWGKSFEKSEEILPTGKYFYFLKVIYRSGVNTYSFKKELTIDIDPPEIDVEVTPEFFSPDGDGKNDLLYIIPEISDLTPIFNWGAVIYTVDDRVFKRFSGTGKPGARIMWDGISDTGRSVGSGDEYYVVFEATDSAFNKKVSTKIPFSIDILVVPTERGLKIQVSNIEFGFDNANLQGERTFEILDRGIEVLNKYNKYSILIEGHTDSTGNEDYNLALSQRRAEAVGEYLIKNGISAERLSYKGLGSRFPIDTNDTPEGRAKNRRVEFILIKKK